MGKGKKQRTLEQKIEVANHVDQLRSEGHSISSACKETGVTDVTYKVYKQLALKNRRKKSAPALSRETIILPEENSDRVVIVMGNSAAVNQALLSLSEALRARN